MSARELQALLAQERSGFAFLMYRDADGALVFLSLVEDRITLGRRDDNNVAIPWDAEVSRSHAEIERMGSDWVMIDDGLSSNGTFVNGARIGGRHRLQDGDSLRLGGTVLVARMPGGGSTTLTAAAHGETIVEQLTSTQRRVLTALCRPYRRGEGFASPATNQEIAAEVFLSVDAVKNHLRTLFHKFEISHLPQNQKRLRLVECAFQWGLVSEREQ